MATPRPGKLIHLIRHGQSRSQTGEAAPDDVDPALSARGRAQARRLRGVVAGLDPDLVVISTMRRAWQTCQLSGIGLEQARFDSRLIESDWGIPGLYKPLLEAVMPAIAAADRHHAELVPVRRRVGSLLGDLLSSRARRIVLFGHWGVLGHLFQAFFRIPAAGDASLNASDNTSLSLLEVGDDGSRRLRYWNERVHLGRLHAEPFW